MKELKLKHVPHPSFTTQMATGLVIHGTLSDGNVQLVFFRDAARILSEAFSSEEEVAEGATTVTLARRGPPEIEIYREDVVSISVPLQKFIEFADVFANVRSRLEGAKGSGE